MLIFSSKSILYDKFALFYYCKCYFLRQTDGHRDREKDRQRDRQTGRETNRPKLQSDPSQPEGHKQENGPCLLIQVASFRHGLFWHLSILENKYTTCFCVTANMHDNYVKIS